MTFELPKQKEKHEAPCQIDLKDSPNHHKISETALMPSNFTMKAEMAQELIDMGLALTTVNRILNIKEERKE